jgi:hypothetical protein
MSSRIKADSSRCTSFLIALNHSSCLSLSTDSAVKLLSEAVKSDDGEGDEASGPVAEHAKFF